MVGLAALFAAVGFATLLPAGPGPVLVVRFALLTYGVAAYEEDAFGRLDVTAIFVAGSVAAICGYLAGLRWSRFEVRSEQTLTPMPDRVVYSVILIAGVGSLYHFAVTGVPVLASNVELARYDFTSSGLLGLPGRLFLFGLPIGTAVAACNASARGMSWRFYPPFRLALLCQLTFAVLSGFKGSLLGVAILTLVLFSLTTRQRESLARILRRNWWLGLGVLAYIYFLATQFDTYRRVGDGIVTQLVTRITVGGSRPAWTAAKEGIPVSADSAIVHDLAYYSSKYFRIPVDDSGYSFSRAVSTHLMGISPNSDLWSPPVTVSAMGELVHSVGIPGAVIVAGMLGYLVARLESKRYKAVFSQAAAGVALLAILDAVGRGGIVYSAFNWGVMLIFMWFISTGVSMTTRRADAHRQGSSRVHAGGRIRRSGER